MAVDDGEGNACSLINSLYAGSEPRSGGAAVGW